MLDEIAAAFRRALGGETSWDEFEAALHRWQESARSAGSGEAAVAFTVPAENTPLAAPGPAEPDGVTADPIAAAARSRRGTFGSGSRTTAPARAGAAASVTESLAHW